MSYSITFSGGPLGLHPRLDEPRAAAVNALGLGWTVTFEGRHLSLAETAERPDPMGDLRRVVSHLQGFGVTVLGVLSWRGEDGATGRIFVGSEGVRVETDESEPLASAAISGLIGELADPVEATRLRAIEAISRLSVAHPEVVAALIRSLTDESVTVRMRAAEALGSLGVRAASAVPALTGALHDPHIWVQSAAAGALGEFASHAESALPALRELERSPNYGPSGRAREALARITGGRG